MLPVFKRVALQVYAWALLSEGSSRTSALIRIGLAFLAWTSFAYDFALFRLPFHHISTIPEFFLFELIFFASSTAMLVGFHSRVAAMLTATTLFTVFYFGDNFTMSGSWTHHHAYLLAMATALCALTPCGKSYSLDRWFAVREAEKRNKPAPPERGSLWGLRLMSLQVSLTYFWTAFDKTTYAFLSGERLEAIFMNIYFGSLYPSFPFFHELMVVTALVVVILEYALAGGLLFSATRRWLLIPGILFHALLYVFVPVSIFSTTVVLLYLAYCNADHVHSVIDRLQGEVKT
jgi:hypothetical protein